jgi:hypothetical protein
VIKVLSFPQKEQIMPSAPQPQHGPPRELPLLTIEDLEFIYNTNFAGEHRPPYDKEGERYFNAKINPEIAEQLDRDGWNVKWSKPGQNHPNPDEFVPEPYIVVSIGFKFRPPTILLIRNDRPTVITEKTCGILDSTEFEKVDVTIRARYWQNEQGGSGYKAWLAEFYGHVRMTELGEKYAYLLDSTGGSELEEQSEEVS